MKPVQRSIVSYLKLKMLVSTSSGYERKCEKFTHTHTLYADR